MDYCALARRSLQCWLEREQLLAEYPLAGRRAGCFVTLLEQDGGLRGCIGTIEPVRGDLADEIVENAVSAAVRDPRFFPVSAGDLPALSIEVSVLNPPEPVTDESQLDAQRYGVVVVSGRRRGVLLPALDGVDTPAEQIVIAKRKARIGFDEPCELFRFEVEKYSEHA